MSINPKAIAVALMAGAAVSPAFADGFYVALDAGQAKVKDACSGLPPGVNGCKDAATLYRAAGGYQFTPAWGAEASYADYGKESAGMLLGSTVYWQASGFQLAGTGTFPINENLSLIAKLGLARTELKLSGGVSARATSTKPVYGIGVQHDFTSAISGRFQFEDLGIVGDNNTSTSRFMLLSIGVVCKF